MKHIVFAVPVVTLVLSSLFMTGCSSAATTAPPVTVASTLTNTGILLRQSTLYPRAIRLAHGPAATNGQVVVSTNGVIFRSLDNGANFTVVGQVPTASGSTERCCATMYELPKSVGALAAGTLLSSASYFLGTAPAIEVYISTDAGTSWSYSSTPVTRGGTNHGLWEPEFEVAADGALVIFWSDETDSCCSQKLMQARSYNGTTWRDETNTVASTVQPDRPGMVAVSKLPSGHFFMSYELCGPSACTVFYRTSTDGWNFGAPSDLGTKVVSTSGQFLEHAPVNVWTSSSASTNGKLLIVGQVLYESNGTISSHNGQLIFVNSAVDGSGPWSTVTAPVLVPTAYDNYCPNYSSALLPSIDGSTLLELASYYNSSGVCMTYYGTGPLQ